MKLKLLTLCTLTLLAGCMTPEDRAAKQALDDRAQLGVTFEPEWYSENAVLIKDVPSGSAAEKAGLKPLDRIIAFDSHKITTLQSLREIELQEKHGATIPVTIIRNGAPIQVTAQLQ